jgi:hypothetical protein
MIKPSFSQVIFVMLFASLMAACQSGAPQEALDLAIQGVKSGMYCTNEGYGGYPRECQDIKPSRSVGAVLTNADKANGYEDRWCVQIDFLTTYLTSGSGWKGMVAIVGMAKLRGTWTLNFGAVVAPTNVDTTFNRCVSGNY